MHQRRRLFDIPHSLYEAALMGAVILLVGSEPVWSS